MPKSKKSIRIRIDGKDVGVVKVNWNATERQKVLAACRLPGVLERLRDTGVAASESRGDKYDILTRLPFVVPTIRTLMFDEYPKVKSIAFAERPVVERKRFENIPFRGLGIPIIV